MTSRYFSFFPKVQYNGKEAVNISKRVKVLEFLYGKNADYLAYTISDGEKAEDIAYYYYGDIGKVWLVYLANNIIDPYSQWPLNNSEFEAMLMTKYKAQSGARGYNIIAWTQNTSITTNIVYYENYENPDLKISKDTFTLNSNLQLINAAEWYPVRYYDYEVELNENKRNIFLVNRVYAEQAKEDLKRLLRNG